MQCLRIPQDILELNLLHGRIPQFLTQLDGFTESLVPCV
jgi:hypothetical protein